MRNPEVSARPETDVRKNYVTIDANGICQSIISVDEDTDMSWTKRKVEEEEGQLRVFKDDLFKIGLSEGLEVNGTPVEQIEDYLEPLASQE